MRDLIYDIEVYPNVFCVTFLDPKTSQTRTFELSPYKDDWVEMVKFIDSHRNNFIRWVGFNNYYYDYQVMHRLLQTDKHPEGKTKYEIAYMISDRIISMNKEEKFQHILWDNVHIVPQVDLYRIHHFDNMARATSLKKLEFNMRSKSIQDLPYKPGTHLTKEQIAELVKYNIHDVRETAKLYEKSFDLIKFREELTIKYDKNFLNHNDTKIGKDYFIMELEAAGIKCFMMTDGERKPVQTKRRNIYFQDIIFPYIKFERPEFNAVLTWLRKQVISHTKAALTGIDVENMGELAQYANMKTVKGKVKNLNCVIDGFQFDFGTGGIHGSIDATVISEDEHFAVIDYDVTSLYPSIAISNKLYPKHLTNKFCEIYADMKKQRMSYAKGTPENAMLKLALNGVYGDSNNPYSPFFDPQYTMAITINGQLMLCMLAEQYMKVEGLKILQVNTDGITIKVPRNQVDLVEAINRQWSETMKLDLERADYSKMFIRDCNNYIGFYTNGKLKRKGKYEYEREWHQDQSSLVVQKAVEAHFIKGADIEEFIRNHDDMFDFMLRTNVPRSSRLLIEYEDAAKVIQNTSRYYMCKKGGQLVKVMPALKQTPSQEQLLEKANTPGKLKNFKKLQARREKLGVADRERIINIQDGEKVIVMNTIGELNEIDYDWYIKEAYKLVDPLWSGAIKDLLR